jgi:hypothetical protein
MGQTTLHLHSTAEALDWLRQQGVTSLTVDSRQVAAMRLHQAASASSPGPVPHAMAAPLCPKH